MLIVARSIIRVTCVGGLDAQSHTQDTTYLMRFVSFDSKTMNKRIDSNAKICMIIRKEDVLKYA